jgi:hypothetical protein
MSANSLPDKCSKCGAQFPSGETCRERFEYCLTLDYEQPESYGAVHHLVVACYMLQHNEYSRRGWLEARALVADAIHHGTAPTELRKRNRAASTVASASGSSRRARRWLAWTASNGRAPSPIYAWILPKPMRNCSALGASRLGGYSGHIIACCGTPFSR